MPFHIEPSSGRGYDAVYDLFQRATETLTAAAPYMVLPGNHDVTCHATEDLTRTRTLTLTLTLTLIGGPRLSELSTQLLGPAVSVSNAGGRIKGGRREPQGAVVLVPGPILL